MSPVPPMTTIFTAPPGRAPNRSQVSVVLLAATRKRCVIAPARTVSRLPAVLEVLVSHRWVG
jgi:hypothetical protein